jgi:membrane associated rhomboid family serine protease
VRLRRQGVRVDFVREFAWLDAEYGVKWVGIADAETFFKGGQSVIIPWRVDVPQDRYPFVNWLIVVAAVAAFAVQTAVMFRQMIEHEQTVEALGSPEAWREQANKDETDRGETGEAEMDEGEVDEVEQEIEEVKKAMGWVGEYMLDGFGLRGLFGHMWLHGGIIHLLGNLLFLWIFGNSVCAKVGNRIYFPLYVLFGLVSAVSHLLFTGGPMLGASGAINGVVGMFLVFFPENDITCWFTFLFVYWRRFTLSSYWMILFWLFWDIAGAVTSLGASSGVAYFAHVGGFAVGFGVAVLMLKKGWIKMERYERSLLELVSERMHPSAGEFRRDLGAYGGWENQLEDEPAAAAVEAPYEEKFVEPEQVAAVAEEPKEDFIRFVCSCGKRVKVPTRYAGKAGTCPKCKKRVQIPGR